MLWSSFLFAALPAVGNQAAVNPTSFSAKVGETAILDCSIPPGVLIEEYFVTWMIGPPLGGMIVGQILPSGTEMSSDRYSVDPTTFALQISNVQLSDTQDDFRCVLGVRDVQDPQNIREITYEQTQTRSLSLTVYSKSSVQP